MTHPLDAAVKLEVTSKPGTLRQNCRRLVEMIRRINTKFLVLVVLPTLLASMYFGFIARDVYVSESHFVVRNPQRPPMTGLSGLLQGTGLSQGNDQVYSVQDFISSRDALQALDERLHLRRSFNSAQGDRLSSFPNLDGDESFEALLRFYQRHIVFTDLDTTSSILTLKVRAFTARQAYAINSMLLTMSETFVNTLNERARQDLIGFSVADVASAEKAAKAAALSVSIYRNEHVVFDPEKQSELQLEQVGRLQEELIGTRKQLADLRAVARSNPQVPVLMHSTAVLQQAIESETAKVAGGRHSLSSKSADYEGTMLERDFANKRLEIALASLQLARENAMQQQLYLERIQQSNEPDVAIEPKRLKSVAATFLLSMIIWGVVSLLLTAVKEHSD
jgi:capsular polysaccharide transport system permease protein